MQRDRFSAYCNTVGERIDLDNDGENELILDGLCSGMYSKDSNI